MKQSTLFKFAAACLALLFVVGCSEADTEKAAEVKGVATEATTETDAAKLKQEIQALETAWSAADNARDAAALAAFYSVDAVTMSDHAPMITGNSAIKKDMEQALAKRPKGSTVSYDVMDVFAGGNYVTETGKTTRKDSTGKVMSTGKYMAVWEKREGKWLCIRDISNEDAKEQ